MDEARARADRYEKLVLAASDKAPPGLAPYVQMAAPAIGVAIAAAQALWPYVFFALKAGYYAYSVTPTNLLAAFAAGQETKIFNTNSICMLFSRLRHRFSTV